MEPTVDPATGTPLPPDAIQRILHIASPVHVYNIPPLSSGRGHLASTWTEDPSRHIFTCRLRVLETSIPESDSEKVKVDILLEDPSSGTLFAAAPYTSRAVVDPAADSSRFFALRVQDPAGGRKATLGIGFEERGEAFDFGVALQEAQKATGSGVAGPSPAAKQGKQKEEEVKRDYSLKEGETITVNLSGTKFGRRQRPEQPKGEGGSLAGFSLPPPPGSGSAILPPPPNAQDVRRQKRLSAQQLGFDDGQFGEFA